MTNIKKIFYLISGFGECEFDGDDNTIGEFNTSSSSSWTCF
jgi:hypothetical protein